MEPKGRERIEVRRMKGQWMQKIKKEQGGWSGIKP